MDPSNRMGSDSDSTMSRGTLAKWKAPQIIAVTSFLLSGYTGFPVSNDANLTSSIPPRGQSTSAFSAVVRDNRAEFSFPVDPTQHYKWCWSGGSYRWNVEIGDNTYNIAYSSGFGSRRKEDPECVTGKLREMLLNGQRAVWKRRGDVSKPMPDVALGAELSADESRLILKLWDARTIQEIFSGRPKEVAFQWQLLDKKASKQVAVEYPSGEEPAVSRAASAGDRVFPWRGGGSAKVTIEEWGDFQCPFSAKAYEVIENRILSKYGDRVRFTFKPFPLPTHDWAQEAAVAAECALNQGNQKAFWALYHYFFRNQARLNSANLASTATEAVHGTGVDLERYSSCLRSQEGLEVVQKEVAAAKRVGVKGTPWLIVNGRVLKWSPPEQFEATIGQMLEQSANADEKSKLRAEQARQVPAADAGSCAEYRLIKGSIKADPHSNQFNLSKPKSCARLLPDWENAVVGVYLTEAPEAVRGNYGLLREDRSEGWEASLCSPKEKNCVAWLGKQKYPQWFTWTIADLEGLEIRMP